MPPSDLIVVGGGEHARVVMEAALSRPGIWRLAGFVDPLQCADTTERLGVRRLGDDDALANYGDALAVLGFGSVRDAEVRLAAVRRLSNSVRNWATVIHQLALISPTARIAPGVVIMAGAIVQSGATIGAHAVINSGAIVEHDVSIGEFTQVASGAVLGGAARVGAYAYVGLGASVRDHVSIGERAVVGMGSTIVKDVPAGVTTMGLAAQ